MKIFVSVPPFLGAAEALSPVNSPLPGVAPTLELMLSPAISHSRTFVTTPPWWGAECHDHAHHTTSSPSTTTATTTISPHHRSNGLIAYKASKAAVTGHAVALHQMYVDEASGFAKHIRGPNRLHRAVSVHPGFVQTNLGREDADIIFSGQSEDQIIKSESAMSVATTAGDREFRISGGGGSVGALLLGWAGRPARVGAGRRRAPRVSKADDPLLATTTTRRPSPEAIWPTRSHLAARGRSLGHCSSGGLARQRGGGGHAERPRS